MTNEQFEFDKYEFSIEFYKLEGSDLWEWDLLDEQGGIIDSGSNYESIELAKRDAQLSAQIQRRIGHSLM